MLQGAYEGTSPAMAYIAIGMDIFAHAPATAWQRRQAKGRLARKFPGLHHQEVSLILLAIASRRSSQ